MQPPTRPLSRKRAQKPEQLLPENVRVGSRLQRTLPRYVRVNTLKCSRAAALAALQVRPPQGLGFGLRVQHPV
jgi:hypothetical protein